MSVLLAAGLGLVGNLATGTVDVDAWWWPLVTWTGTALLVAAAVVVQRRLRTSGPVTDRLARAEETLARLVRRRWDEEAAARALDQPIPMPVRWRVHELSTADDVPAGFPGTSDRMGEFAGLFRTLDRQRLIVLGGAGAGKTTLAVQLLRALLREPRGQDQHSTPVPVLLPVSDWTPTATGGFRAWLAEKIDQEYPLLAREFGPDAVRLLVEENRVLPVLDSLDELPAAEEVIGALRASLTEDQRFIVTCRTERFLNAVASQERPSRTVVIEPEPLTGAAIAGYLRRCLRLLPSPETRAPRWDAILIGLESPVSPEDPLATLGRVVSSPLGLWLLRVTYLSPTSDPGELLDARRFPDEATLRRHLFDQLIPAVVRNARPSDHPTPRPPRRGYEPEQLRRRLQVFASLMESMPSAAYYSIWREPDGAPTRDFRWWYMAELVVPRKWLPLAHVAIGVAIGAMIGALQGAFATGEPAQQLGDDLPKAVTGALGGAFIGLLIGGWQARSAWDAVRRIPRLVHVRSDWSVLRLPGRRGRLAWLLAKAFAASLALFFFSWALLAAIGKLWDMVAAPAPQWFSRTSLADLPLMIPLTMLLVLIAFWHLRDEDGNLGEAAKPTSSVRAELSGVLVRLAVGSTIGGLLIVSASSGGLSRDLLVYNSFTVTLLALTIALLTGPRLWLGYLAAVVILRIRTGFPLRFMAFLDDAHRLGLLRTFGPAYQFRHADLQDHLSLPYRTRLEEEEPAPADPPPPAEDPSSPRAGWSRTLRHPVVVFIACAIGGAALTTGLDTILDDGALTTFRIIFGLAIILFFLWGPIRRRL